MRPECPVCGFDRAVIQSTGGDAFDIQCSRCGFYRVTGVAMVTIPQLGSRRYLLSGVIRRASDRGERLTVTSENVNDLVARAPAAFSISRLIEEVLLLVADRTASANTLKGGVLIYPDDYPIFFLKSEEDLYYVLTMLRDLEL